VIEAETVKGSLEHVMMKGERHSLCRLTT